MFALITTEDPITSPKDKKLQQLVSDKLGREFIGTVESDLTLQVMFDLEQLIGRNIIWTATESFEDLIYRQKRNCLPNKFMRFCTTEMKLRAIFEYWFKYINEVVEMRIGYRYDELERAESFTTSFKYANRCNNYGKRLQRWENVLWREGYFPLIEDKIIHLQIRDYWQKQKLVFPKNSNCLGCFWKGFQELRQNWETDPNKMEWFAKQEDKTGRQFKKEASMRSIKNLGLEPEFNFGFGSGCASGFCTD